VECFLQHFVVLAVVAASNVRAFGNPSGGTKVGGTKVGGAKTKGVTGT
jgi:hypothetical protein